TTPVKHLHGNWPGAIPVVYRWPYDYSRPDIEADYLPQTMSDDDLKAGIDYTSEDYDPTDTDIINPPTKEVKSGEEIIMLNLINQKKKDQENKDNKNNEEEK